MKKKGLVIAASVMLVLCLAVGGTLAWLSDQTVEVKNTFTYGDINIDLTESENLDLKMVPGNDIEKDPVATVKAGSEDCYLFVKIEKNATYDEYLADYVVEVGEGKWTLLEESDNTAVYYREVAASDADQPFYVLAGDTEMPNGKVTVLTDVEKADMEAVKNGTTAAPTLTFTAYAVQKDNLTVTAAWNVVK